MEEPIEKVLILTVGLPRSGKSTWAQKQGLPIVSADAIRLALYGRAFEGLAEDFVWAQAAVMVRALFLAGNATIILDATSITKSRRDKWKWNPLWEGKVPQWVRKYQVFDTPMDVCKERAIATDQAYLLPVIDRMAADREDILEEEMQDGLARK
jgi:predicted kinase